MVTASRSDSPRVALDDQEIQERMCVISEHPKPVVPSEIDRNRELAILENRYKWMNGTTIHYYLIPSADGTDAQKAVVRRGFEQWAALGIGLIFEEVTDPLEAELRITFDYEHGKSSSFIGTYNLKIKHPAPTMRFGWDLRTEWGHATVLHEIGHAIGLKHEHQNPNAGIVWDEPAVIKHYEKSDDWDEETTRHNVINKLDPGDITATDWDVHSIMHYPIAAGLIKKPEEFSTIRTPRNITFSERDVTFISSIYPVESRVPQILRPMMLVPLPIDSGQQTDLLLSPNGTRDYEVKTVGKSDARIVAFEERDGKFRFLAADDDSAKESNASLHLRLVKGRKYVLKVRLYSAYGGEGFGVMMV
jgi:hypothetical protein